jgi:hypothetical protein
VPLNWRMYWRMHWRQSPSAPAARTRRSGSWTIACGRSFGAISWRHGTGSRWIATRFSSPRCSTTWALPGRTRRPTESASLSPVPRRRSSFCTRRAPPRISPRQSAKQSCCTSRHFWFFQSDAAPPAVAADKMPMVDYLWNFWSPALSVPEWGLTFNPSRNYLIRNRHRACATSLSLRARSLSGLRRFKLREEINQG